MRLKVVSVLGLVLTVSACRGDAGEASHAGGEPAAPAPDQPAPSRAVSAPVPATDFRYQFVEAAKAIAPSLVSVKSESEVERPSMLEGMPFDFLFRGHPAPSQGPLLRRGIGSGVIVDESGHVLTNNHVVADADKVQVVLANGHEYAAKVVGTDAKTDLAVLMVEHAQESLPPAVLGDSETLQVGEWVVAAGSPFGLRQTVSAGIVSALGRGNVGISEYEDFIQTDAAVNPGNSGGPLVDLSGRVIGINTAIASSSGGNNGVGFAIPIAMAKNVMKQLIETGKVVRGYVGLYIGDVTRQLAESFGYKGSGGVLVQDVTPGGPGANAGIQAGDIVMQRDGKPVRNSAAFRNGIADSPPGTQIDLTLWREGKEQSVKVELGELPGSEQVAAGRGPAAPGPARWGLALVDPTPEQREQLKLGDQRGAVVAQIKPQSPADDAGLRPGDLITRVGDSDVSSAVQAQRALIAVKSPVRLRIIRDGHGLFLILSEDQ